MQLGGKRNRDRTATVRNCVHETCVVEHSGSAAVAEARTPTSEAQEIGRLIT